MISMTCAPPTLDGECYGETALHLNIPVHAANLLRDAKSCVRQSSAYDEFSTFNTHIFIFDEFG